MPHKINHTICLDAEISNIATEHIPNLSKFINDTLKTFLIDAKPEVKVLFDVMAQAEKVRTELEYNKKELVKAQHELDKKRLTSAVTMRAE